MMLRHRRRTARTKNYSTGIGEDFSNIKNMFDFLKQPRELKTELQRLQLENKLNAQIRQFIDKRLEQIQSTAEK